MRKEQPEPIAWLRGKLGFKRRERHVVVLTDRLLMPPHTGNRIRILGLIRCLRGAGYRVALVGSNSGTIELLEKEVDNVFTVHARGFSGGALRHFDVRPYRRALRVAVSAVNASVVIAEYAWMAPAMAGLPNHVLRCVDCHDVLHERFGRFVGAGLDPWVYCTRVQEQRLLSHAHVVLAIQHLDAAILKRLLPHKRVVCVVPFVELPRDFQRKSADTMNVLAVGANHAGNEGIRQFANGEWGRVVARLPRARLQVAGGIAAGLPPQAGVEAIGEVEDLYPYYEAAAVVVCPVEIGTGLKIKMVEALRLGKAVVATSAAAEGLPVSKAAAWVRADSIPGCAEAVVTLLSDRKTRMQLEDSAFIFAREYLSKEAALANMRSILPGRLTFAFRRLLRL